MRQQKAAANASMPEKLHARRTSIFKRRAFNAIKKFFLRLKYSSYATDYFFRCPLPSAVETGATSSILFIKSANSRSAPLCKGSWTDYNTKCNTGKRGIDI